MTMLRAGWTVSGAVHGLSEQVRDGGLGRSFLVRPIIPCVSHRPDSLQVSLREVARGPLRDVLIAGWWSCPSLSVT